MTTSSRSSLRRRPGATPAIAVLTPVLAPVLATVLLAGCGGNGVQASSGVTDAPVTGSSASASASPSSSPTAGATATTGTSPSAAASPTSSPTASSGATGAASAGTTGTCPASGLAVGLDQAAGGGAAGSQFVLLTFRNTGASRCVLDGHPGVSFVGGGAGRQIGSPAVRTGSLRQVSLAPGQTTTAVLQVADAGNYDAATCAPTTSDGLRVYPPGSRVSRFVAYRTQACQGSTGSSPQLQVSAVGRAQG
ncbi:hypothetical protein GCM10027596_17960 [Nocardioides korecus]